MFTIHHSANSVNGIEISSTVREVDMRHSMSRVQWFSIFF